MPTYKNITLAGSSSLTVINSYLGVDFSNETSNHNQLVLTDNSKAEMYGVSVDTDQNPDLEADRQPAFVTIEKTIEVTPFSLDTSDLVYPDNSSQNIAGLQVVGDLLTDIVGPERNLHINEMNVSGLSGSISKIVLSIRYSTASSFASSYLSWSLDGLTYTNTTMSSTRFCILCNRHNNY